MTNREKFLVLGNIRAYADATSGLKPQGCAVIVNNRVKVEAAEYISRDMKQNTLIKWIEFLKEVTR